MAKGVVLVTGAGSGIGQSVAVHLASVGYTVYGASRSVAQFPFSNITHLQMDVCKEADVRLALETVIAQHGRIDAVINSAGLGMLGAVEDCTDTEAREIFDTNLFGMLNVCRNIVPIMRNQGSGYIINITSMAAQMALPFRGIYSSSKFAVEGFSEALSQEVRGSGIHVVIIEPGDFKTAINGNRRVASSVSEHHRATHDRIQAQVNSEVDNAPDPIAIARLIVRVLEMRQPSLRYRVARPLARFANLLRLVLPDRWFERLLMRRYSVK